MLIHELVRGPSGSIFDELNLFNNETASFFGGCGLDEPKGHHAVNLYEGADDYVVTAEIPGVDPEKIDITQEGDTLTLRSVNAEEPEATDARYYRRERDLGSFERSIKFTFTVNPEDVEARFKNGLLTVTVKKPEEQKPKKIEIKNA